jgi:hypothetical protein
MSLILSLRMTGVAGLTTDLRSVVQRASAQVGQVVEIPEAVADRVGNELTAQAVADVIEVRRRERSVPADVLALHLG